MSLWEIPVAHSAAARPGEKSRVKKAELKEF